MNATSSEGRPMPSRPYRNLSKRLHVRLGAQGAWDRAITLVEETRHDPRTIAALVLELKRARAAHLVQISTGEYRDSDGEMTAVLDARTEHATTEDGADIGSEGDDTASSTDRQMSHINYPSSPASVRVGGGGLVVVLSAEAVRAATAERGWSLSELARRARISRPTLASALRGRPIWARTAWKLARALEDGTPSFVSHLLRRD